MVVVIVRDCVLSGFMFSSERGRGMPWTPSNLELYCRPSLGKKGKKRYVTRLTAEEVKIERDDAVQCVLWLVGNLTGLDEATFFQEWQDRFGMFQKDCIP